jgi:hypothetical protein
MRGLGDGIASMLPAPLRDDSTHGACVDLHTWQRSEGSVQIQSVAVSREQRRERRQRPGDSHGNPVVIDLEEYESFARMYGFDTTQWPGYPVMRSVREFLVATWVIQKAAKSD